MKKLLIFALLAILLISGCTSEERTECITHDELKTEERCLVAVNGNVYDMEGMNMWEGRTHEDCECGGSYIIEELPETHTQSHYMGKFAGRLCE